VTVLFTFRAPASATAPSPPMLLTSKLQYTAAVIKNNTANEQWYDLLQLGDRAIHFESPRQRHRPFDADVVTI
jgi:hypothetical protein